MRSPPVVSLGRGRAATPASASWASSAGVRAVMVANRSRDTSPEVRLRRELHRRGLRFRVACRPVPSLRATADIVFGPARVAVFVNGCFWHACPQHYRLPRTNRGYWRAKAERNVARDLRVRRALRRRGWSCLTVWEHAHVVAAADRVERKVRARRDGG